MRIISDILKTTTKVFSVKFDVNGNTLDLDVHVQNGNVIKVDCEDYLVWCDIEEEATSVLNQWEWDSTLYASNIPQHKETLTPDSDTELYELTRQQKREEVELLKKYLDNEGQDIVKYLKLGYDPIEVGQEIGTHLDKKIQVETRARYFREKSHRFS